MDVDREIIIYVVAYTVLHIKRVILIITGASLVVNCLDQISIEFFQRLKKRRYSVIVQ